jgi:hypothetical protein
MRYWAAAATRARHLKGGNTGVDATALSHFVILSPERISYLLVVMRFFGGFTPCGASNRAIGAGGGGPWLGWGNSSAAMSGLTEVPKPQIISLVGIAHEPAGGSYLPNCSPTYEYQAAGPAHKEQI